MVLLAPAACVASAARTTRHLSEPGRLGRRRTVIVYLPPRTAADPTVFHPDPARLRPYPGVPGADLRQV